MSPDPIPKKLKFLTVRGCKPAPFFFSQQSLWPSRISNQKTWIPRFPSPITVVCVSVKITTKSEKKYCVKNNCVFVWGDALRLMGRSLSADKGGLQSAFGAFGGRPKEPSALRKVNGGKRGVHERQGDIRIRGLGIKKLRFF